MGRFALENITANAIAPIHTAAMIKTPTPTPKIRWVITKFQKLYHLQANFQIIFHKTNHPHSRVCEL